MKYQARKYQKYTTEKIINEPFVGAFLDMGLGKSVSTLTAINELKFNYFQVNRVLVIAPLKVAETTWSDEIEKWKHLSNLTYTKVLGTAKNRKAALNENVDIYIMNRENVTWLVDYLGDDWFFDMVVLDESSSFKNYKAKRTKSLIKVRPKIKRLVELSGTPSPRGLEDLWSQVYLLDQGERLGKNITAYRSRYFDPQILPFGCIWKPKTGADEAVLNKISDICITMKSEDYLELPPMIENIVKVELDSKAKKAYQTMEKELILELPDGEVDALSASALSIKLLQIAGGAVYGEDKQVLEVHKSKIDALTELIESLQGEPVIVFYSFVHELDRIRKALSARSKLKVRAFTDAGDVKDWNAGKIEVLLAHPASTAYGLNMQDGGHHIIWFGLTWNYEEFIQANKRLHRSGQDKPVIIHQLVCKDTRDEDVLKALNLKDKSHDFVMESLKARIEKYRS